jgi:putative ABC transport system substrate-binding protein
MRRREFLSLLGSAAVAWPLGGRAQQVERMRRIGVLMNLASDDPEAQTRIAGYTQGLQELGWAVGRNVRVDYRWGGDADRYRADRYRRGAEELVSLAPDLILASTNSRRSIPSRTMSALEA